MQLSKYWDLLPWEQEQLWLRPIARDNVLGNVAAQVMSTDAGLVRGELDDLAVLVLFSVFESIVRDAVEVNVRPEVEGLRHPALVRAGEDVLDAVSHGSVFRLLEPYKAPDTNDVVEQVNQVRKYRNWVAHGKRPDKTPNVLIRPKDAYERLGAFLTVLNGPPTTPTPTPPI